MPDRRVRTALRDALNGDAERIDPAVKRGLLVLAVAQDDADDRIAAFIERQEARDKARDARAESLERKITGVGVSIVVSVLTSTAALIVAFA